MSLINIHFLPEAEIYCHNVSQKLIKLVREFRVSSLNDYIYFMKCSSSLVLCECDIFGTRRMNSCKIGPQWRYPLFWRWRSTVKVHIYSKISLWLNTVNWILSMNKVIEKNHVGCRIVIYKNSRHWFRSNWNWQWNY